MPEGIDTRVKMIFGGAIELVGADRDAYLASMCGEDATLRARVEALLAAAEKPDEFLRPAEEGTAEHRSRAKGTIGGDPTPGSRIGAYQILEELGEGGFGAVYLAEQREPVRRRVALKVIKAGMDTRAVIARFEQERQALAIMDHPNIAKVFDAGATESGRPYFVMELVTGEPITEYCDRAGLGIRERLELFMQVCRAVQHAHSKGLIHRDIKPGNVLVSTHDGRPVCKVIDFGIAKAMQGPLTARTLYTESRQLIGTPEYMSPEQASGSADIDTRSDVYALGVLAYELLAGAPPFDPERLRSAAYAEMQRIIREVDPPAPSTRLSQLRDGGLASIAAHRRLEPERLSALLRGELDWIVMKALEKERSRRYETPSALASDVERFLAGEPVAAAPPSAVYRARKFIRRNRAAVVASGLVATALLAAVVGTSTGLVSARRALARAVEAEALANDRLAEAEAARAAADTSSRIAAAVTDFFTLDVLNLETRPEGEPEITVREVLERIPERIDRHFRSDPAIEGAIRERVGQLYLNMGDARRAAEFIEPAAQLLEQGLGADHASTLRARQRLGRLLMDLGRYERADVVFDQVYQSRLRVLGPNHNFTMNSQASRGTARVLAGRRDEGLRDVRLAVDDARRQFGRASQPGMLFERQLIETLLFANEPVEAERLARDGLAFIDASAGSLGPIEADFRALLGAALLAQGRFEEAMAELDAVWALWSPALPASNPRIVTLRTRRGVAMAGLGRHEEAASELLAAYAVLEPVYGSTASRCREIARALADVAASMGDEAGAAKWRSRG